MTARTIAQVAHLIEHELMSAVVPQERIPDVLDYVRAGFDNLGQRIPRSEDLEFWIKTMECNDCRHSENCPPDCPVKPFKDLTVK